MSSGLDDYHDAGLIGPVLAVLGLAVLAIFGLGVLVGRLSRGRG